MKNTFLAFLCSIAASSACFASNEGVPSYYSKNTKVNANRAAYSKYQDYGYTKYVGNSGRKQIISSKSYSYQVPRPQIPTYNGAMTANGIAQPSDIAGGCLLLASDYASYISGQVLPVDGCTII